MHNLRLHKRHSLIGLLANWLIVLMLHASLSACKKDDSGNPYDDPSLKPPPPDTSGNNLPVGGFAWLHQKVFKPTCANSGCHDGTFEPDYRTINSAYNSLVYQPVIKNDPNGTYTYRVLPGNADMSVLVVRLTTDIDGQSGIMPIQVDPNGDWEENQTMYIQAIRDWINGGAKDVYGNPAQPGNLLPQVTGVMGFVAGTSTPLALSTNNVMEVPAGTAGIDVLFAVEDDISTDANIGYNKFKFTQSLANFAASTENDLQIIPAQSGPGIYGGTVQFTRKASINTGTLAAGTVLFIRVYLTDEHHTTPAEIPSNGTSPDMVQFFCVRVV